MRRLLWRECLRNRWILPIEPVEMTAVVDIPVFASVLFVTYGVGWLVTQFYSSSFYASLIGFPSPFIVAGIVAGILNAIGGKMNTLNGWVSAINLPIALVCFSMGTWCFLRRALKTGNTGNI